MRSSSLLLLSLPTSCCAYSIRVTPWDALSKAMKGRAREWFIQRATDKGIDWKGKSQYYLAKVGDFEAQAPFAAMSSAEVTYPAYYTRPFHGYDEGNLNWLAACELEASTESMSSGYFSDVNPAEGAARMRQTFADNIQEYAARNEARPLKTLLDMGCSIGISTQEHLARLPSLENAVGVDLSPHFLSLATHNAERRDLPISYVHANVDELDMPESADVVTIAFVFHEMPPEAIAATVRSAYRTLRPGGVLAVLDLDPPTILASLSGFRKWGFEATEPHIFSYYDQNIASHLVEGGFANVWEEPNDPYNHGWFGIKPVPEWGI